MKSLSILLLAFVSLSAFAQYEVNPTRSAMKVVELEDMVVIQYPVKEVLIREAVGDVLYYGSRKSGRKVCKELGYGSYVKNSKKVIKTRAVSTNNLAFNMIEYRLDPIGRLADNYEYPKTKIIQEIACFKN